MAQPNWYRICVGCGTPRHKKDLLRIVRTREGKYEIDWQQKQAGRGAYVCRNLDCAIKAKRKRGFNRSFRSDVPGSLYDELIQLLSSKKEK
ncbi:MAG: YlxR family protein [candidate division KSB1 bacterium]|nr:YlxR family protein [candidate division KSB1 bacterium]MDZ7335074.1 YlxR family protein [candidate division KSB1 bacterium]MDZ7356257.1 YlxR family protein [candidate division KSB1 bacterium]MDZ7375119.1 YlxR family protein [candidate division KSB1 bacterium]MDZ7400062.1 YlxR family protein [candidate division KSB1 bacterium]